MDWKMISESGDRPVNEDSAIVVQSEGTTCFVVADGLGGHGKGEVASGLAVKAFETVFRQNDGTLEDLLAKGFLKAQEDILEEQKRNAVGRQMRTTVCALAIRGDQLVWGHIGDTRLYAFAHNRVKVRTLDHSVPQMLVLAKEIKEKEIRHHPDRNKLLRALGNSGEMPKFEICHTTKTNKYQAFLLCSDGFWEYIQEKEMCALLKKNSCAQQWLEKMQETVKEHGAQMDMDNYTAIAIRL